MKQAIKNYTRFKNEFDANNFCRGIIRAYELDSKEFLK